MHSPKLKVIIFIVCFLVLLQFLIGLKIYYNRIYIYNISQYYIIASSDNGKLIFTQLHSDNQTGHNDSLCPSVPPALSGPVPVVPDAPSEDDLERKFSNLDPGGHWRPHDCAAKHKVAIIIPYRDRDSHLRAFLHHMHPFLQKQQLDYAFFVVEQIQNQTFNRGKLLNIGFTEAMKSYEWDCAIFHDVDLLPENDRNLYSCPDRPRHMSVAIDKFDYELPYKEIFGGVTAMRRDQFRNLNGYSNDYWGWGGEDDNMASRIELSRLQIERYPPEIARYKMIKHVLDKGNSKNPCRYNLNSKVDQRWLRDGLNNLTYDVVRVEQKRLHTRIVVDLLEDESRRVLEDEKICGMTVYPYMILAILGIPAVFGVCWVRKTRLQKWAEPSKV